MEGALSDLGAWLAVDVARLTEPDMLLRLLVQVLLLAGSAFFSGSETALFSLSELDLQKLRREEHPQATTLYRLLEQPRRLIISVLCGNELINVAAAANMAAILVALYGDGRAELLNVCVMVPLLLLLGEVTPKTIAVSDPVRVSAGIVAAPMWSWVRLVTPLRELVRLFSDRITSRIVAEEKSRENLLHADELKSLVDEAASEGGVTPTERTLVYNLLAAGSTEIVSIMTPRTQTLFIDAAAPLSHVIEQLRRHRFNRVPVVRRNADDFVGFLHAEDFIELVDGNRDPDTVDLATLIHPPVVVPPTKRIDEMFDFFQDNGEQAAMVIDEFGGLSGMITMKAVLRFIFSHVAAPVAGEELYEERDANHYVVPGDMKLADFNRLTRIGLTDPRMTTVAGVMFRHLDRLPRVGDTVSFGGITMRVCAMDRMRIARVEVELGGGPASAASGGTEATS
ncbi:MAG: hemolysin family protein [Gammaproteobacteria bacterium]